MADYKKTVTGAHKKGLFGGMFSAGTKMGLLGAGIAAVASGGLAIPFMIGGFLAAGAIGSTYAAARWGKESIFNLLLGRPRLNGDKVNGVDIGQDGQEPGQEKAQNFGLLEGVFTILAAKMGIQSAVDKAKDIFDIDGGDKGPAAPAAPSRREQRQQAKAAEQARLDNLSLDDIGSVTLDNETLASGKDTKSQLERAQADIRQAYRNDARLAADGDRSAQARVDRFLGEQEALANDPAGNHFSNYMGKDGKATIPAAALESRTLFSNDGLGSQFENYANHQQTLVEQAQTQVDAARQQVLDANKQHAKGKLDAADVRAANAGLREAQELQELAVAGPAVIQGVQDWQAALDADAKAAVQQAGATINGTTTPTPSTQPEVQEQAEYQGKHVRTEEADAPAKSDSAKTAGASYQDKAAAFAASLRESGVERTGSGDRGAQAPAANAAKERPAGEHLAK